MTDPVKFPGFTPCEKINACEVDAYVSLELDPENPTGVILSSSWGDIPLDLKSIVKAGETVTHLELAPEDNPTVIRYFREDGTYDCIPGDELSRIISLQLLKDVDQTNPPSDGIVYQFNETTSLFEPYDLKAFVAATNHTLNQLSASITNLQNQINAITAIIPFWDADKTMKLSRGTINIYSDVTNTNDKTDGIFTHDKSVDKINDEYFS